MNLELGKKIAALRKMQGTTQAQLADYLMVQPQTVSRWESEGGTPDVTLLPKIASFFGISMDELFGLTDMEQIDYLVYKYSVLRDEKSFDEVMKRMEIALQQAVEEETEESRQKKEQLLAWKVHIYIQKSRKAQEEAETILDSLLQDIDPESELRLPLTLQKNQFLIQKGEGRDVLKKVKSLWEETQNAENLHCYMMALTELDLAQEVLSLWESEGVQNLVKDINSITIPLWQMMFSCAKTEQKEELFQIRLEAFRKAADEYSVFEAEWLWTELLKNLGREEEKEKHKKTLLETVERLSMNEYLKMNYRKRIQEL